MKGWPDYVRTTGLVENYDEYGQNYPVGIGDGAGRLGSIKTYDMRGRAWWMDDFEAAVLKWVPFNAGAGGSQALSTVHARNGNQSVRLVTNTGAVRHSQIMHHFPQPRNVTLGVELSASMGIDFGELRVILDIYDGIDRSRTTLRFLELTETIYYLNDLGGWTDTGFTWCAAEDADLFNTMKIVTDYNTNEYIRLLYDYQELAMHRVGSHVLGSGVSPRMVLYVNAIGDNVHNTNCYIDDVIITIMEPE